jgi:cysteine-rich repeat protein
MRTLVLGSALFVLTLALPSTTRAGAPLGYAHATGIDVLETSGVDLTDYQVRLVLDTGTPIGAGEMQADGRDLLFTSGDCTSTVYPHWVESGIGTDETVVWVKVPSLPAGGGTRVVMWYGNASATNPSATKDVFVGGSGGPLSGTGSLTSWDGNLSYSSEYTQEGFAFQPNVPLLVVGLGKYESSGTDRTITLFDSNDAKLAQTVVSGEASTYSYADLPSPLWLAAAAEYTLAMFTRPNEWDYQSFAPSLSPDLAYVGGRFGFSANPDTCPTMGYYMGGYADLAYYKRQVAASEPDYAAATTACVGTATCEATCNATACGDGTVNALAGEQCDDGNTRGGDGCSSKCLIEKSSGGSGCGAGAAGLLSLVALSMPLLLRRRWARI